jgi:hypothetical protein
VQGQRIARGVDLDRRGRGEEGGVGGDVRQGILDSRNLGAGLAAKAANGLEPSWRSLGEDDARF